MQIKYFLNDKESGQAYFKLFSSECDAWVKVISGYTERIQKAKGVLQLKYQPSSNSVTVLCSSKCDLDTTMMEDVVNLHTPVNMNYTKRLLALEEMVKV